MSHDLEQMATSETANDLAEVDSHQTRRADVEGAIYSSMVREKTSASERSPTGEQVAPPAVADPNLVDWDGPNDPANPRNWSKTFKMVNISLVSLSVLYCNLATTMFAPGANIMEREFHFNSETIEVLTVTIASLGFAVGPLFVAPLSEVYGRVPIYRTSAIFYLGFTVGCARSTHVAEFLIFRLLTGFSAASYMSCGGGTIADLLPKEERGAAIAMFTAGPLLGPVIGPIIGGFVSQSIGWRWTFYLVLILAGVVTIASFILMRETNAVMILAAKTARLRKLTGNPNLRAINDRKLSVRHLVAHSLLRPPKMLIMSPIVLGLGLYLALIFGVAMLLFATFPIVYEETYHWSVGVSGLAYIGVGVGSAIGLILFAKLSDPLLRSGVTRAGPERRLLLMMYACPLVPIGLIWYGWATDQKVHWVVPIIGTAVAGIGVVVITSSAQTYVVDMFGPQGAASALAAITLLRNMAGAFLSLAAPSLYGNLGLGWGNNVLGFLTLAFVPMPFVFYWRGAWLRNKFPVSL